MKEPRCYAGLGLRAGHYAQILERGLRAECAEAITENFMNRGGRPKALLEQVRSDMPVILHGVGLSIGSVDPLDVDYLTSLRDLVQQTEPLFVSDHLCFGGVDGHRGYDLWPLPYTEEAASHVAERVLAVQDYLGRQIALENVSSYVSYSSSEMSEVEFLVKILEQADCLCLLDVNNIYVSASNLGYDPCAYLAHIPTERVAYFHLAGHADYGTHLLDDHGSEVPGSVWGLFQQALELIGPRPTIVEWDSNLPRLERVEAEAAEARALLAQKPKADPNSHRLHETMRIL